MKKVLLKLARVVEQTFNIQITPIDKHVARLTAVQSDWGFWYAGDIHDRKDIAYGIFRNGIVEAEELRVTRTILETIAEGQTPTVFDIGANTGLYTIMAATLPTPCLVHSFEPLSPHVKVLQENISINGLSDRVSIHPIALGETAGTAELFEAGSGSSLVKDFVTAAQQTNVQQVSVKTLDDLFNSKSVPKPDFIKIDVEGFEYSVLTGARKLIADTRPILFIEIATQLELGSHTYQSKTASLVFDMLSELGYNAYIVEDGLTPVNAVAKRTGVAMYLFVQADNLRHQQGINKLV